jgi:hypothetical protein
MGRRVDVDDLVTADAIAEQLGVNKGSVVHDWIRRDIGFPDPVVTLGSVRVWAWPDVEKWAKQTGRIK